VGPGPGAYPDVAPRLGPSHSSSSLLLFSSSPLLIFSSSHLIAISSFSHLILSIGAESRVFSETPKFSFGSSRVTKDPPTSKQPGPGSYDQCLPLSDKISHRQPCMSVWDPPSKAENRKPGDLLEVGYPWVPFHDQRHLSLFMIKDTCLNGSWHSYNATHTSLSLCLCLPGLAEGDAPWLDQAQ